jgi:chemotaxis family two-component system sensor kinase Cph1
LTVPESEEELLKACNELARQVGSITGCQRVLVYRFCHDWSGEVVAESCRDERRFTGLRFPASDIPARVRELYLRISQRLIPDMAAAPVPVIGRQASARLDLTYSDLRSVPDVHRIYMGNMGVVAAFSIAVLVHGRLWGIVSAHHPERRYLSWGARQRVADAVQLLGLALSAWQSRERIHALERLEKVVYPTLSGLLSIDHLVPTFLQSWTLVELLGATGSVLMHEDRVERLGEVPDAALNGSLKVWLDHKGDDLCLSERLAEDSLLDVGDSGAGLLAIRVHYFAMGRRTTLYWCWFRPEEATEVRWAGRPEKEVSYRDGTPYLTPRRSFDLWVEVTRGQSRPWSHFDQLVGRKLRTVLLQRLRE